MPGGFAGPVIMFDLLCYGFRLDFPRIVTFYRGFILGFLLPALLGLIRISRVRTFVIGTYQERSRLEVFLQ
jgi:uncharacterized integral membrane protein